MNKPEKNEYFHSSAISASSLMKLHLKGQIRVHIETLCLLSFWLLVFWVLYWFSDYIINIAVQQKELNITDIPVFVRSIAVLLIAVLVPTSVTLLLLRKSRLFAADIAIALCLYVFIISIKIINMNVNI